MESSLSVGLPELRQEVGFYKGLGRGVVRAWTAAEETDIDRKVQSGVRRVYYPPAISPELSGYEWSWLRPTKDLSIISGDANYDLPDDFGRLVGGLEYPADQYRDSIAVISVSKLLAWRAINDLSGWPRYAATRYKASDGSGGQRQEILFFPKPDQAWTLSYEYEAYNGALTEAYPYPLGGMQLAELYIESCLAVCEADNDEAGLHTQTFQALLVDAVKRDKKRGAKTFGCMGHKESYDDVFRRGYTGQVYPITYKGDPI